MSLFIPEKEKGKSALISQKINSNVSLVYAWASGKYKLEEAPAFFRFKVLSARLKRY